MVPEASKNRWWLAPGLYLLLWLSSNSTLATTPPGEAVASAHPQATKAGLQILRAGGNAFDAAVAVSAVLAVVEPYSSGLGGGGFWLLHRESDQFQVMIDGRETAPLALHAGLFLDAHGKRDPDKALNHALAAGIPGTVAGMEHMLREYGRLDMPQVLAPAIALARNGITVTERYRRLIGYRREVMLRYPESVSIFFPGGELPAPGARIMQTDLAWTLERIARHGAADFYRGAIAKRLLRGVSAAGGIWQTSDLANYQVKERTPVTFNYHDMRIVSAALPSSGGVVLSQTLGILQHFTLGKLSAPTRKHVIIEAMRRAYRDRAIHLGDPDFITDSPLETLLDQGYLRRLSDEIDMARASRSQIAPAERARGNDTTHFSIIDRAGNRVAATLSVNLPFGTGLTVPNTGILLNNELDDFAIVTDSPNTYGLVGRAANRIEPGKRPLSSMSPTFVETPDRIGILGTPGGSRIISMVLLAVLDMAEGHLPDSWVALPRYHHQHLPDEVQFEQGGLNLKEQQQLRDMGHRLKEKNRRYGNMQAILWLRDKNELHAASDPRGEGLAQVNQRLPEH